MRFQWLRYITVEPSLLLYMTASFMNFPLQQQLVYSHYCNLNPDCSAKGTATTPANESSHTCGTLSKVSSQTSHFNLYLTLAAVLPGALMTLLLGAWSDGIGRTLVMGLPVAGAASAAIVNVLIFYLKLDILFLVLSSFISGMLGSYAMFNQASFAYVADVTSQQQRTRRLGILEAMIYLGMTLGSELGGVWRKQQGFGPPFCGVLACYVVVLSYVSLVLPESKIMGAEKIRTGGIITKRNLTRAVGLVIGRSPVRLRMLTILIAFVFATLNFNGIIDITIPYLFDQPFRWDSATLGHFLALGHFLHGMSTLVVLPLLLKRGVSDIICIQIGILSSAASLVVLAVARSTGVAFLVPIVGSLRGMVVPCVRSSLSKLVAANEQGALFSLVAVLEILCTVLATLIYNNLYPATCAVLPHSHGFAFLIMAGCLTLPLALFRWIGLKEKTDPQEAMRLIRETEDSES